VEPYSARFFTLDENNCPVEFYRCTRTSLHPCVKMSKHYLGKTHEGKLICGIAVYTNEELISSNGNVG